MKLKGKVALFRRWIGMIVGSSNLAIKQGVGKYYKTDDIAGYYNDLTGKVNDKTVLDDHGIPMILVDGGEKIYFPTSVFQYSLGLWDMYLERGDEEKKERFLSLSEWALNNQRADGSWDCFGAIKYSIHFTVSSMGQGEGISVLLRAYKLTGDVKWLEASRRAVKFMMIRLEDGGTLLVDGEDHYFEEYPDMSGYKRTILNGWIFSLFGIYDYLKTEDDEKVRSVFEKSVATLKRHLPDYDAGYWSFYDRTGRVASPAYHELHIALLRVFSDITKDDFYRTYADRWEGYSRKKLNKMRAIAKKAIQKLKEPSEGIVIQ